MVALASVLTVGTANAGTYAVVSCLDGAASAGWTVYNGYVTGIQTGRSCGSDGTLGGMYAQDHLASEGGGAGGNGSGAIGVFTLTAPVGTVITGFTYSRYMDKAGDDGSWRVQSRADDVVLEECYYDASIDGSCSVGMGGGEPATFTGLHANALHFGIWCMPYGGGIACTSGYAIHHAQIVVYSTSVTINDPVPPDQVSVSGVPGGWQRGVISVTATGRDSLGIKRREVLIDGAVKGSVAGVCDPTSLTPCETPGQGVSGAVSVDTTGLAEGTHSVSARAIDAAENATTSAGQNILIDNTAPAAPVTTRVGAMWGGSGDGRQVSVDVPAQTGSPIAAVRSQSCLNGACGTVATTPVTGTGARVVPVPELSTDGEWTVRTWLVDDAGNESTTTGVTSTTVGLDTVAPSGQLYGLTTVDDGQPVSASLGDVSDPSPSSGSPTSALALSVDGASAVPFHDGAVRAVAGHEYVVTATLTDPVGNTRVLTRTISVAPAPPVPTPTTATTPPTETTGPPTTPTTPTTTTGPGSPPKPRPAPVAARLRIDVLHSERTSMTVTGRADAKLAGKRVTVQVRVPTIGRTVTRTVVGRVRAGGGWRVRLTLPRTTVQRRLAGRTLTARTAATTAVRAGVAKVRVPR
jgi:hypothetical protein